MIDRILKIASVGKEDIVLDSFAGSGTTAHAVLNMNKSDGGNRKFILVEMGDYADTITAERVKLAANSLKPIFASMPHIHPKAVVWLVPSDAILSQTYKTLTDKNHAYRKKIDVDFGNKVEVYSKQQLLNGQNFNPTSVSDNLSILY